MEKLHEKIERELAEAIAKLEQYQHNGQRMENRIKYYRQRDRTKQNYRLIACGAAVESVAPEVRGAFFLLVKQVFSLPEIVTLVSCAIILVPLSPS